MKAIQVFLFGKMDVIDDAGVRVSLPGRARELLAYLLINQRQPYSRESLASVLWEEASSFQAKKYLRQALWQLQRALKLHDGPDSSRLLCLDQEWLGVHREAPVWTDVEVFDRICRGVRDLPGADFGPTDALAAQNAVGLYRGDLLSGCYRDWCLVERERLQSLYLSLLDKLIDYCGGQYRFDEGLAHGMRALRIEPTRETTYRRLMRLHARAGDRAAAMLQYRRCKEALKRDLGVEPSDRTRAVWAWIRDDPGLGTTARASIAHGQTEPEPLSQRLQSVVNVGVNSPPSKDMLDQADPESDQDG